MTTPMTPDRLEGMKKHRELCAEFDETDHAVCIGIIFDYGNLVDELIREVKRQRLEIIDMKEELFIDGTYLEKIGSYAGWRDTQAMTSMMCLGDELVALGVYEKHPDGVGRRWWYRKLESKP